MEYIKAAKVQDLGDTAKKLATVNGRKVLIVRVGNEYFAVENTCTHMGGSLYDGVLDGYTVVCPRHGSGFDVRTGALAREGKLAFLKVKPASLGTYPVKINGDDISIGI